MKHVYRLLVIAFLLIPVGLVAQTSDCLREAETKFNQGLLSEITEPLEECLSKKNRKTEFTIKEEEIQAWKLLTKIYIYLDDQRNANRAILGLLKSDPEHVPDPSDPAEFVYLYRKYSSKPIFAASVKAGGNLAMISDGEKFSAGHGDRSTDEFIGVPTVHIGIGGEYRFYKDFELGLEIRWSQKAYEYSGLVSTTTIPNGDYNTVEFTENQQAIEVPVFLKYSYDLNPWVPFAYAGFQTEYLLAATVDQANREPSSDYEGQGSDAPSIDLLESSFEKRENLNFSAVAGLGVKLKVLRINYLVFDVRYAFGLTNPVNGSNRYLHPNNDQASNQNLGTRFLYVDNDFTMNNLAVSIGFIKSFYRTKNLTGDKSGFLFFGKKKSD